MKGIKLNPNLTQGCVRYNGCSHSVWSTPAPETVAGVVFLWKYQCKFSENFEFSEIYQDLFSCFHFSFDISQIALEYFQVSISIFSS